MIFSRFFTPDYAKPDPSIRKAAASQLSPDDPKSKQILHELAFNDSSAEVNLAALEQLNSFALWQKTAQTSKNERVKRAAKQKVSNAVLSSKGLTETEKKHFLQESADTDLISDVLMQDETILNDKVLVIALLNKVNKPQFTDRFFKSRASLDLQSELVSAEEDSAVLQKWLKKAAKPELVDLLQSRLDVLNEAKQKPLVIAKAVTLILSKLQALHEQMDYAEFTSARGSLEQEYSQYSCDFDLLKERDKEVYVEKKNAIDAKLSQLQARLEESFALTEKQRLKDTLRQEMESSIALLQKRLTQLMVDIEQATIESLADLQQDTQKLVTQITDSRHELGTELAEPMLQSLSQLTSRLTKLPDWQRHSESMRTLFDALNAESEEALAQPESIGEKLSQFKGRFDEVFEADSPLKAQHLERWRQIKKSLLDAQKQHKKAINDDVTALRTSINITGNLIAQGKFRPAMARFTRLNAQWESKPDNIKTLLQRRYDELSLSVSKLEGWQEYLAGPRKPALIEQAQSLIDDKSQTLVQRAEQIKLLRKQWQSLSLTKDPQLENDAQQQAFDDALEKAFEPCRAYFAEQEEKRNNAIAQREALIERVANLVNDASEDYSNLYAQYEACRNQWREADKLPTKLYVQLKGKFDATCKQVDERVNTWLAENAKAKQSLISQAQQLRDSEPQSDSASQAKQLQQKWKSIATAGRRQDTALWREFRTVNDEIFKALGAQRDAQKQVVDLQVTETKQALSDFSAIAMEMSAKSFNEQWNGLVEQSNALPRAHKQALQQALDALRKRFNTQQKSLAQQAEQDKVTALISLLNETVGETNVDWPARESWSLLNKTWQDALKSNSENSNEQSRSDALLMIEIALGIPSPEPLSQQRQQLQMRLLADNMGKGRGPDAKIYLQKFLSFGALKSDEASYITRLHDCLQAMLEHDTHAE